ncbi:MAG TPA: PEP-CTERM sorting domain-containing protein [Caldimonas sp.]|nr:PEP-CTERM sorting domain-containing protein [Caldimonas sp.]
MKKLLSALALAALATSAGAQVTFTGGTDRTSFANYNPNGSAATLAPTGGKEDALLNTTAGILTATFLGFEAIDTDTFTFTLAGGTLNNKGALNASISGPVTAGALNFTFADLFQGTTVGNGGNPGSDFTSYAVLGTFAGAVFTPATLGGAYDLIIGFNDGLRVDADYDDMVIGLRVAAIPEPETYALLLAGLGAVGFIARRRQRPLKG